MEYCSCWFLKFFSFSSYLFFFMHHFTLNPTRIIVIWFTCVYVRALLFFESDWIELNWIALIVMQFRIINQALVFVRLLLFLQDLWFYDDFLVVDYSLYIYSFVRPSLLFLYDFFTILQARKSLNYRTNLIIIILYCFITFLDFRVFFVLKYIYFYTWVKFTLFVPVYDVVYDIDNILVEKKSALDL